MLLAAGTLVGVVLAGCATTAPVATAPAVPTSAVAAPTATAPTPAAAPVAVDPVAFFRAQEPACRAHAAQYGNSPAEPQRFSGARLVRRLGDDAYLVVDGLGTRLVVRPAAGVVLPESGRGSDPAPDPYRFACPETVFLGSSD